MKSSLQSIKADLSALTRQGISAMLASVLLWSVFAVLPFIPGKTIDKSLIYVVGACLFYPLTLAIGALLRLQLFPRDNPLSIFFQITSALQLPFLSILVATYLSNPELVPWYLGVISSVQFLLFAWLFDSSAYLFCALGVFEVSALIGWLAPGNTYELTPASIVLVLLISSHFLTRRQSIQYPRSESYTIQRELDA